MPLTASTTSRQIPIQQDQPPGLHSGRSLVTFAFFLVCSAAVIIASGPPRPLPEQSPLATFSAQRAVKHLASISRAPHPIHSQEHNAVRDYIMRTLQGLGFTPQIQKFADSNASDPNAGMLENIMCRLPGSAQGKALLLVAHYDSVRAGPGASDDGVAVAAFLENARILKSLPQLKRDVIFLFTDGEEQGLLGSRAFVSDHPWAHEVAFVLNFEARGNSGPSIMFETSDENGWMISNFGLAASHPVANSLSYEIYKRMPNDTDFTVFREAGYSGLNFAFIGGLEYYHTPNDSIANVQLGSLQHHGDYVLELTKQFGNAELDDPKQSNAVYFDVLGRVLVHYGQTTAISLLVLTGLLLAVTVYLGIRKKYFQIGAALLGLVSLVIAVAAAVLGSTAVSYLIFALRRRFSVIGPGLWYHSGLYILAFVAIGLACAMAVYCLMAKWISSENLTVGALLGWFGLAIGVSMNFAGASYLLLWPLLFSVLGRLVVFGRRNVSIRSSSVFLALTGLPAIILVVPLAQKIFFAFASNSAFIVSALLGLVLALLVGQFVSKTMSRRWLLPGLMLMTGAALLILAITVSAVDKQPPQLSGSSMQMDM